MEIKKPKTIEEFKQEPVIKIRRELTTKLMAAVNSIYQQQQNHNINPDEDFIIHDKTQINEFYQYMEDNGLLGDKPTINVYIDPNQSPLNPEWTVDVNIEN